MATVTEPKKFNHEESQRRVRHPLQLLRSYIRRYIILEGLALTLLCVSGLFWLGLAFDFGLFNLVLEPINLFGIDWILELNDLDTTGAASLGCRIVLFTVIVIGLLTLGFTKVVWRWVREFNDRSLALVLERRFPKQLGDRLITAVELADPKLAAKYGFSQIMIEKTIQDAIETLKTLPVANVFNWRRLYKLWAMLACSTVGLLLLNMVLFCGVSFFTQEETMTPVDFGWKFYDVSAIWTERNVMMKNTYWPRDAHLEIEGFQPSKEDENDMRVPKDDETNRPDLQVRAFEWVIADRDVKKAPYGWRPLTWKDLSDHKLVDPALLAAVTVPKDFEHWVVDGNELEPHLRKALFGENEKNMPKTSGEMHAFFKTPAAQKKIADRGADETLDQWLDWTHWTVDKIALQKKHTEVRVPLREPVKDDGEGKGPAVIKVTTMKRPEIDHYSQIEAVFEQLKEKVQSPMMSRTIRKLTAPADVVVKFIGEESSSTVPIERDAEGNKFRVSLESLKDSPRFKFRARGANYFTPAKTITLVAAVTPKSVIIDKEEPAYLYHRLRGTDQMPLRGLKHTTKGLAYPTSGETNTFEVPLGTNFTIHVETERKLRAERAVVVEKAPIHDPNFDEFRGGVTANPDQTGFSLAMTNITRNHDFMVEFYDEDNIRGKRRFKILRTLDSEPVLGNLNVFGYLPRKPRFKVMTQLDKDTKSDKDKDAPPPRDQTELMNAYLITPDANIPFECAVKDDYGLVHVGYHYKYRKVDFELVSQGRKKLPALQLGDATRERHAALIRSNFQFWPGSGIPLQAGVAYLAGSLNWMESDIRTAQSYREAFVPCAAFDDLLARRSDEMINMEQFKQKSHGVRSARPWEFDLKDSRDTFDVRKYLKQLKADDPELGKYHFLLQLAVQATDNNVETGADYIHVAERVEDGKIERYLLKGRGNTKKNANGYVSFLVVTENDLLSQIALEEEILFEKLETAKEKIDAGMTSLLEQQSKTRIANPDVDSIIIRMNEIRTGLGSAGNSIRDAKQAYDNILTEMEVNRVKDDRKSNIENKIVRRLDLIVQGDPRVPDSSSLQGAEDAFAKANQLVEEENNAKRPMDIEAHRLNMNAAHRQMHRLSNDVKELLDAMSEGIVESKLIAMLVTVEGIQRKNSHMLHEMWLKAVEDAINELIKGKDKEKVVPDKKKPDEKKSSRLQPPLQDGVERGALAMGVGFESRREPSPDSSCPCWRADDGDHALAWVRNRQASGGNPRHAAHSNL